MKEKALNSLRNYEKALSKLREFIAEPVANDRDRAGIIKAFRFTFELACKTFQKVAKDEQMEFGGPKTVIKQAFKMNYIGKKFEPHWIQMLEDRNLMGHIYREDLSFIVSERIKSSYVEAFNESLQRLKDKYE
jgi:nucleotidyltransferase substrate binding protein (TIGR01987 family)